jgi:hypothetical protein
MNNILKFLFVGMLILTSIACDNEQTTSTLVQPSYAVPPTITAMNVEIDGKKFYIENGKDGWEARPGSKLTWGWACVEHTVLYYKTNETNKFYNFHFALPRFPVEDMSNVAASYNYRTFLDFVGKGQKILQTPSQRDGYQIWFSYVDAEKLSNSYSYRSETGSQPTGKIEVTNVKELGNNQVVVTYALDCDMHTDMGKVNGRLKGTIQLLFNFKQF